VYTLGMVTNADRFRDSIDSTPPTSRRARRRRERGSLAVGYCRVSTVAQARDGVSLDAQRIAIEAEAGRRGLDLVATYSDEGISGRRSDRPGLAEAIAHARRERATLVVYSLSRFSRSAADALALIDSLDRSGSAFVSVSEGLDTGGTCGRMVTGMLAVQAQWIAETIAENTRDTLAAVRASGRKTGGDVPYGFDADADGLLAENPREQEVIDAMLAARARGVSLRRLVDLLNENEIPTRRGGRWHLTQVKRILDRESCESCGTAAG